MEESFLTLLRGMIKKLQDYKSNWKPMKNLGGLKYSLGIDVIRLEAYYILDSKKVCIGPIV